MHMMLMVSATEGLWIFGIEPGPSTTIFFPILVDISRFENAMYDLIECPGIKLLKLKNKFI